MKEILILETGDNTSDTALTKTENKLTDEEKIRKIKYHFSEIMDTLGLDLTDDSLKGTPERVAKMYVKEIFSGLNPENKPQISLFENKYSYKRMLVEKDITLYSSCEHHFVPIIGKVHVAYFPGKNVIGLSKINRLVQYHARRPQVQERLTIQIAEAMKEVLGHDDVAVYVDADHLCVASRGIKDTNSRTLTSSYSGLFEKQEIKQEFLAYINN
ncbi:MAG TPA: GTP cyclohydrolase I FolE [Bacteroidia bacterium]|nr:MAG: GTP cyclohydrolase [Bacteroidetes bacterium OLB10]MBE7511133.1 GTP cyclohydrolase I FolE [Bacteroidia bacterium]MBX3105555.1 GTP cyclohydrolase I FolE [Bacteroidota bacterium]MCE7954887.1 GTP cyclohydrolase I FolE [Bacteroidetes bacterium CHB6]OQB63898.1 MAG: GTP cyclohydrolase 1 [Bacteroidetes bacterium ADurb.Bin141]